jgi:hypothetical protein
LSRSPRFCRAATAVDFRIMGYTILVDMTSMIILPRAPHRNTIRGK